MLTANAFGDVVFAELNSGAHLPRIPPARYGFGLDGYNMLTADVGWRIPLFGKSTAEIYLQGRNLLDAEVRRATSFLKDVAPAPGVSVLMGARITM